MQHVGRMMKNAIILSGRKQKEIATFMGISSQRLNNLISKENVDTKYLFQLGKLLNVPYEYFLKDIESTDTIRSAVISPAPLDNSAEKEAAMLKMDELIAAATQEFPNPENPLQVKIIAAFSFPEYENMVNKWMSENRVIILQFQYNYYNERIFFAHIIYQQI